ncbi:hypothetical protein C2845_PM05G16260 [Panicum miliaceum]|uniref:Uncharacterized protein n=1 Tax=Panicum miliaceum TaxID=4540 RepID=A0A3L6SXN3_PANMI|nr:hypothetical protein C2845_PM05G16260 [Panicum miliaceum]
MLLDLKIQKSMLAAKKLRKFIQYLFPSISISYSISCRRLRLLAMSSFMWS